jgi:hypothetical protein
MSETTNIYPVTATSNPGFNRFETCMTPATLRRNFLWGIPLKAPNGEEMGDDQLAYHIESNISVVEHILNVTITPTQYVETHDYRAEDYDAWFWLQMRHRPMHPDPTTVSVQIQYITDQTLIALPNQWYRIYSEPAQIQMTPTAGTMGQFFISQSGAILPGIWGSKKDYPQLIKVTYIAGFEQDKIPKAINQLIGYKTALDILEIMRDLIGGMPGIGSYGLGLDGLSQSISKEGFAQRIASYTQKVEELTHIIKMYYTGITMSVS